MESRTGIPRISLPLKISVTLQWTRNRSGNWDKLHAHIIRIGGGTEIFIFSRGLQGFPFTWSSRDLREVMPDGAKTRGRSLIFILLELLKHSKFSVKGHFHDWLLYWRKIQPLEWKVSSTIILTTTMYLVVVVEGLFLLLMHSGLTRWTELVLYKLLSAFADMYADICWYCWYNACNALNCLE